MAWEFHPGMKVVCIDDSGPRREGYAYVKTGGVYTIREIVHFVSGPCLLFNEIRNRAAKTSLGIREPGFAMDRFRPLRERKSDISIFRAILNGHRVPEDA